MKRELVDVQLYRGSEKIGSLYTTEVDHTDPTDVRGLFQDALVHANVSEAGCSVQVWRRSSGEELFSYTAT